MLRDTKDRRKEYQYNKLREEFALVVHDRRIYKSGGVGTYSWMPKLKCYRVQVGASHISTKCHSYPYARCVEIYDVL